MLRVDGFLGIGEQSQGLMVESARGEKVLGDSSRYGRILEDKKRDLMVWLLECLKY